MKELKETKKQFLKLGLCAISALFINSPLATAGSISKAQRDHRLEHAQELLGKYYDRSVVRTGEQVNKINKMVYKWTYKSLPKSYRKQYQKIAQTIIDESLRHQFDPVFVMAVIRSESSFNPRIIGGVGEIGLMQIRPSTGKWIAGLVGVPWKGKKQLKDPVMNIKLGTAYLAYLRDMFDSHARLYLAAYNMGQGNVKKALNRKVWPKVYPIHVMNNYVDFYSELQDKVTSSKIAAN